MRAARHNLLSPFTVGTGVVGTGVLESHVSQADPSSE